MSSDPLSVSREDILDLTQALNRLSAALERHLSATSTTDTSAPVSDKWERLERSQGIPTNFGICSFPGVLCESPSPPPALLEIGRERLVGNPLAADRRVWRAFEAGYRSWAANLTGDFLSPAPDLGLTPNYVVVTRLPDCDLGFPTPPFRLESLQEIWALFEKIGVEDSGEVVYHSFQSLTEVQVFCVAAQIPLPELWRWTRTQ